MNRQTFRRNAAAFGLLLSLTSPAWSQLVLKPAGSLRIEGDSTLHKWSSTATLVEMTFTLADGAPALPEAIAASQLKGLEVRISVAGLKSGESGLDKNMRVAMKADKFPDVVYTLGTYALAKATDGGWTAKTAGRLTIAGTTKDAAMDVEVRPENGVVGLRGAYTLDMSDFGIAPPKLMLGAIKVRDPVTIRFDLQASPAAGAPNAGK